MFVKIVVPFIKPHYLRNLVINAVSSDRIEPYLGLMFPVLTFRTQVQIKAYCDKFLHEYSAQKTGLPQSKIIIQWITATRCSEYQ